MEDLDWCHRFWDAGWKVFYEPAGVALHVKGASSGGRRRPKQEIAFHRGMARFYRRFDAPEHNPLLNARRLRRRRRQTRRRPHPHQALALDAFGDDYVLEGEAARGVGPDAVVDRLADFEAHGVQGGA